MCANLLERGDGLDADGDGSGVRTVEALPILRGGHAGSRCCVLPLHPTPPRGGGRSVRSIEARRLLRIAVLVAALGSVACEPTPSEKGELTFQLSRHSAAELRTEGDGSEPVILDVTNERRVAHRVQVSTDPASLRLAPGRYRLQYSVPTYVFPRPPGGIECGMTLTVIEGKTARVYLDFDECFLKGRRRPLEPAPETPT